ncbi:MAG: DUF1036 domain-containing protein [Isosphaeraceae bacterium]
MRFLVSMGLTLAAILAPVGQTEAWAWFKFTNKTSKPVYVAFVRYEPGCEGGVLWEKRGWWRLETGQTKTVQGTSITNRYSYYYAESDDRAWTWTSAGPSSCFPQPSFTWCWNTCNNSPSTRWLNVRKVDSGSSKDFTVNLTPPTHSPRPAAGPSEDATEDRDSSGSQSEAQLPTASDHKTNSFSDEAGSEETPEAGGDNGNLNDPMAEDAAPPLSLTPAQAPRRAMPASPHPVVVTQPDGSKVALRIHGDEKLNWQTDMNGYPVVKVKNGKYVYATLDSKGRLKPTDQVVGKVDAAAAGIKKHRPKAPAVDEGPPASNAMRTIESQPLKDPMDIPPTANPAHSTQTSEELPQSAPDAPR